MSRKDFHKNPNKQVGSVKRKQGGKMNIFSIEMVESREEFSEIL